jgi:hypothetical protein
MEFIEYLLLFILLNLAVLYFYQNIESICPNSELCKSIIAYKNNLGGSEQVAAGKVNSFNNLSPGKTALVDPQTCSRISQPGVNQCRLAGNMGPVQGFHQSFKQQLPELGWRNFYLRFFNGIGRVNQLQANNLRTVSGTGFNNIVTRNYLEKLPSTDNIYKYTDY